MTPEFEEFIGRTHRDFKAGKKISPVFSSAEEMDVIVSNSVKVIKIA